MHDIDKTMQEIENYFDNQDEELSFSDSEDNPDLELEVMMNDDSDYEVSDYASQYEELDYTEEMEISLASELLSVSNEEELDYFIGKLFRKARKSGVFKKIGGAFKKLAKKALPIAGGVVGGMFGGPLGSKIGGRLGSAATKLFEIDADGITEEDLDFEVAKRFVRFANATSNALSSVPPQNLNSNVTNKIIRNVAAKHAPGLLKHSPNSNSRTSSVSGRWVKQGNRIIVIGV